MCDTMTATSTCPECDTEIYYDEDSQKWICGQCGWQEEMKIPSKKKNNLLLINAKGEIVANLNIMEDGSLHPDSWIRTPTSENDDPTKTLGTDKGPIESNNKNRCLRCGAKITDENDSKWEEFTEDGRTTQKLCKDCNEKGETSFRL